MLATSVEFWLERGESVVASKFTWSLFSHVDPVIPVDGVFLTILEVKVLAPWDSGTGCFLSWNPPIVPRGYF